MTTLRRSLNVIIKSKMSKIRTNINVQEFLRDTNKKVKICSDNDKSLARIESIKLRSIFLQDRKLLVNQISLQ